MVDTFLHAIGPAAAGVLIFGIALTVTAVVVIGRELAHHRSAGGGQRHVEHRDAHV